MKNSLPLISVVIATHNSERTIERCLKSIKTQTYPHIETIVVDSLFYNKNSQKKCRKIIEKYATYFQDGPERSIQRNRGIKEAKGEYVLVIDQDMYLTPKVIEDCYVTFKSGKYIALNIPEKSIGEGYWTECVALDRYITIYLERGLNECCRFFRKKDVLSVEGYDPLIVGAEDADLNNKMAQLGTIGKIKSVIYHDEGKTSFFGRIKKKYYYSKAFGEYLKRYPTLAPIQFSPFKSAYIKHWQLLVKDPLVSVGMFTLKGSEAIAGGIGLLFN